MYNLYVDAVVLLTQYVLSVSSSTHTKTKYSIQDDFNILKIFKH